jgi:predicted SAM-dependent methyltransferase
MKLHLGCGNQHLTGWINVDIISSADVVHDLTKPLPFENNSIEYIFNEHFIEHLTYDQGKKFLEECYRVLIPNGILRISTPNLDWVITCYIENRLEEWQNVGWRPKTKCQLMNEGLRLWGHQYVYNDDELKTLLKIVGFNQVISENYRQSNFDVLKNIETRPCHNELIIEATK